jgi:hypothetical protein
MSEIALTLATDLDDLSAVCSPPELLLGRHCLIVGNAGSGKSWSLARIVEQIGLVGGKVVLLDPSGEFSSLHRDAFHIHLGNPTRDSDNFNLTSLPYFQLLESDLISFIGPETPFQLVKLRAAMKTLKLLQAAPHLSTDGNLHKARTERAAFESELLNYQSEIDRPGSIFNIYRLPLQIELECIEPTGGHTDADRWGASSASQIQECAPLVEKLHDMLRAKELRPLFAPSSAPSVFKALEKFVADKATSVLRVSLEFLATTHGIRALAAHTLARHLLSMSHNTGFTDIPVVLALDEAHQLLSPAACSSDASLLRAPFELIAQEGRKRGISVCLTAQRTSDVPGAFLSQLGTCIVHRIINGADHDLVQRIAGGHTDRLGSSLAELGPGEAFLCGAGARTPRHIKMLCPVSPPVTPMPNYQLAWTNRKQET